MHATRIRQQTCKNKRRYGVRSKNTLGNPAAGSCRLADRNAEQRQGAPPTGAVRGHHQRSATDSEGGARYISVRPQGHSLQGGHRPWRTFSFLFFFLIDKDDDGVVVLGTGGPGKKGKRKWKPALPLSMAKWSSSRCCTVLEGCEQG